MEKISRIWPLLILIFLQSCVYNKDAPRNVPEYSDAVFNEIAQLLSENKAEQVIQKIYSLRINAFDSGEYSERIQRASNEAEKQLVEKYYSAFGAGSFLEAAEYLKSIKAAGIDTEESSGRVYLEHVLQELNTGAATPGLAVFQDRVMTAPEPIRLEDSEYSLLFKSALENRNTSVLTYLLEMENVPDEEMGKEASDLLAGYASTSALISGTVTIWINRGIKLSSGVGYPDRVIGSGFYIDTRGYILTSYHVIESEVNPEYEGYSRLYIKFDNNEDKIPARVAGWDPVLDIALLKAEINPDYIYSFPEKREYIPGEKIFAIGSPGGLDKTITSGIISAAGNRRLLPLGDTIQIDVPINSGNSGGPVVDEKGALVGIVFAGIEQFEGVNFLIPSKWVLHILPDLYREGKTRQAWLGLTVIEEKKGLEIIYVMPGTSSFSTGLEKGDIITEIDGIPVKKIEYAQELILMKKPGTLIRINVLREEKEYSHILMAEKRDDIPMNKALEIDSRKNLLSPFFGMSVEEGDSSLFEQEFIITRVHRGMPADDTGLSVNDPFSIVNWYIDEKQKALICVIRIKKRKAGFMETAIQLGSYLNINNTL